MKLHLRTRNIRGPRKDDGGTPTLQTRAFYHKLPEEGEPILNFFAGGRAERRLQLAENNSLWIESAAGGRPQGSGAEIARATAAPSGARTTIEGAIQGGG